MDRILKNFDTAGNVLNYTDDTLSKLIAITTLEGRGARYVYGAAGKHLYNELSVEMVITTLIWRM